MYLIIKCMLVLLLLIRAVYTDVTEDRIENRTLLLFMVVGGGISLVGGGYAEFFFGIKMALIVTVILFLLYMVKGLGAGDIKLLAVLAVYLPKEAVYIVGVSFVVAGMGVLLKMALRGIKRKKILIVGEKIHFSIPIAIATVLTLLYGYLIR